MNEESLTSQELNELKELETESRLANKINFKELGVLYYFILYLATYWGLIAIYHTFGDLHLLINWYTAKGIFLYIFYLIPGFTPVFCAIIVLAFTEGKVGLIQWLKRLVRFKFKFYWYLIPIFLPIIAYIIPISIYVLTGNASLNPFTDTAFWSIENSYILGTALTLFMEEPGVRGYATSKMNEKRHPLVTGATVGFIWAIWHLPNYYYGARPWYTFPQFVFTVIIISCIYTWMFIHTDSIIPGMLFHFMHNICNSLYIQVGLPIYGGLTYLVMLGIILLIFGLKLQRPIKNVEENNQVINPE